MSQPPQSYANHRRYVPLFHFAIFGVLVVNLLWRLWDLVTLAGGSAPPRAVFGGLLGLLMSLAFIGIFFYCRVFALTVQNRVIRLEERLRLERLLPADLAARTGELSTGQLIAIRFASDGEVADLVRQVLDESIRNGEEIKKRIRVWRADDLRA